MSHVERRGGQQSTYHNDGLCIIGTTDAARKDRLSLLSCSCSSDEENSTDDGDDDDDDGHNRISGDKVNQEGRRRQPPSTGCALRRRMQWHRQQCSSDAIIALLAAHADLDDLMLSIDSQSHATGTNIWQNVLCVLKRNQIDRVSLKADVKRDFRKRGLSLSDDATLTRCIDRLAARIDQLFSNEQRDAKHNVRSHTYTATLAPTEQRALNACVQIWRKMLRGCSSTFNGTSIARIDTCIDVSVLGGGSELVVCTNGQSGPVYLKASGINVLQWDTLRICCNTIDQWKQILTDLLPFGTASSITRVAVQRHCRPTYEANTLFSSVPPCVFDKRIVEFDGVHDSDRPIDNPVVLGAEDVLTVLEKHAAATAAILRSQTSSLVALSIGVLKRYRRSIAADTPPHLRKLVHDAYRCVSCRRIILPPPCVRNNSVSIRFERAAVSAGFSMRYEREKVLRASLRERSLWLPPFEEIIVRSTGPHGHTNIPTPSMRMGGYHVAHEPMQSESSNCYTDDEDDDSAWRFCLSCGAAHLAHTDHHGWVCRCVICQWDRQRLSDSGGGEDRDQPVWRRMIATRRD